MDILGPTGFIIQVTALVGFVSLIVGISAYVLPRTTVGRANERYTDALEGEGEVNRRTIARLESDVNELEGRLHEALAELQRVRADILVAKGENDRLRAENGRLHDRLAELGAE